MCSLFSSILGRTEHSTGWARMQSVNACAVQTHLSVFILFLKKVSHRVQTGFIWGSFLFQNAIFVWKNTLQKMLPQKVPRQTQVSAYSQIGRLPEKQPRVRTFPTRNSCSSNNRSTVRIVETKLLKLSKQDLWSDTPWARSGVLRQI